ncbi:MAG: energy-coupling factor transporter ATPase [Clostridia bacterium]|nr:energy-coupling factor transporter ATPase [Clostridia bacterium]
MSEIIKIENLIFEYIKEEEEKTRAIDGVSFSIEKGSFTAIIGKNGSGKSTLAKNVNGLLIPTEGVVYVNGMDTKDDSKIWDIRQSCGMVFQNPDNQLVSSIVEDDVAFGPENIGVAPAEIRTRVDEALKAVGMESFKTKAPHLLSGGQKQRIAIAGAIAMKPDCIIFDEPTAMLDPKGRDEIMNIIQKLHAEGITVVLITHFMEEAAKADRIIIMDEGKVVLDGSPVDVFEKRDFLKSINLDVPFEAELCARLRKRGIEIPKEVITLDEMVNYLCQLK